MNLLEKINAMACEYTLSNGFSPDRVIIGPDDREELRRLYTQHAAVAAPRISSGGPTLMGMLIEYGPKTEVRAARLDLVIAR